MPKRSKLDLLLSPQFIRRHRREQRRKEEKALDDLAAATGVPRVEYERAKEHYRASIRARFFEQGRELMRRQQEHFNWVRRHGPVARFLSHLRHSRAGRNGAAVRWRDRSAVAALIERLAGRNDALGDPLPPAELWTLFYSELEAGGLRPRETSPDRYEYNGGHVTRETFARAIHRSRQKNSHTR